VRAQCRRRTLDDRWGAAHPRNRSDLADTADDRIVDLDDVAVMDHLRMVERLLARCRELEGDVLLGE
jgi:hypothetical protein